MHHTFLGVPLLPLGSRLACNEEWKCGGKLLGPAGCENPVCPHGQDWKRVEAVLGVCGVDEEQEGC